MPENKLFPPEGAAPRRTYTLSELRNAAETGTILEGIVQRCSPELDLTLDVGGIAARMPRAEVTAPWISGAERDIAVLSRVGKQVCFTVQSVTADAKGAPVALLSRQRAQTLAMNAMERTLRPGSVVSGRVVGLKPYGAFVDIGRGIVALLPTAYISTARVRHPAERFRIGQLLTAAVKHFDRDARRITLTHRELLGTWMENASRFSVGETVRGTVRSVTDYGCFVELTPNLSGLTDRREDLKEGDRVSVQLRSIRPDKMKIKLQVIEPLPPLAEASPLSYWITDSVLDRWVYSPANYEGTPVETVFTEDP